MVGVLVGFAIIASIIATGYGVGRAGLLGEHAPFVLNRLVFFVLSPCLLFTVVADADVHVLFSSLLATSALAAAITGAVFLVVSRLVWRRGLGDAVVGALGSSYVNANNIGIPVSVYVLGNAAYSAPVILVQLIVFAPIALAALDVATSGTVSWRRIALQPLRNPITVASLLGVVVAVTGVELPADLLEPFRVVGAAAVPLVLLGFGMSLHGRRPLAAGSSRRDVILAAVLKLTLMPLAAWALGLAFGLGPAQLFAVVVLAALPSAQNVFTYAQRYQQGVVIARDVVLVTTIASLPVILLVAALLAPH